MATNEGTDAAQEYERLRGELAEFVLEVLTERIAAGQEPELAQALVDAIDRKVDAAVAERLSRTDWPDPADFADEVIRAAAGRGGGAPAARRGEGRSRSSGARGTGRTGLSAVQLGLLALAGIAIVAIATILFLRGMSSPATTFEKNLQSNRFEQTTGQNNQQIANEAAAPVSAGGVANVAGGGQ